MSNQVWRCTSCGNENPESVGSCFNCASPRSHSETDMGEPGLTSAVAPEEPSPVLPVVFRVLAVANIVGGIVLAVILRPGEPPAGYSGWKANAYVDSVTWFLVGLFGAFLLLAIADGLAYLNDMRISLRQIAGREP